MAGKHVVLIIVSCVLLVIVVWCTLYLWRNYVDDGSRSVNLASDFQITSEWQSLGDRDKLRIDRQINFVALELNPPFVTQTQGPSGQSGIRTPDGVVFNPDIRLIGQNGEEYRLTYRGSRHQGTQEFAEYKYLEGPSLADGYKEIRIRSDIPITVRNVVWSGYNASELK